MRKGVQQICLKVGWKGKSSPRRIWVGVPVSCVRDPTERFYPHSGEISCYFYPRSIDVVPSLIEHSARVPPWRPSALLEATTQKRF